MAEQMRPTSKELSPDPSFNYERSHPERESASGRLDKAKVPPHQAPDQTASAVTNVQDPSHQINADDVVKQPDHSMKDEEPLGWDQSPLDIHDPNQKRHPKVDGKGGTPDDLS